MSAVNHWRDRAFLADGAVFDGRALWTVEGLEALETHFVRNLDEGVGTFIAKLESQLKTTSPHVKQLAAEMLWLMFLCPSNMGAAKKRSTIETIWQWSGEELPSSAAELLSDAALGGIGSAGPGFNNHRWRELTFCINTMLIFKRLPVAERKLLIADGWRFAKWLSEVPDATARQFRHMLLFMLFPDDFERIFGRLDRRAVAVAFSGLSNQAVNALSPLELDRTLRRVRSELEEKHSTPELDYYTPPLKGMWQQQDFRTATQDITADHVLLAIAQIDRDGVDLKEASTGYDLLYAAHRYPPKLVLSLAAKHARGTEFDRSQFAGGEDSSAFRLLRSLSFEIVPKAVLPDILKRFLTQASTGSGLAVSGYPTEYRGLQVKVSFGKGVLARVPWIAFLGAGHAPTKGSYPVLLYYRKAGYVIVAYGIGETHDTVPLWRNLDSTLTIEQYLAAQAATEPERYGDSYVAQAFSEDHLADIDQIAVAIDKVIDEYKPLLSATQDSTTAIDVVGEETEDELYTLDEALEGLFIDRDAFGGIVQRLRSKHNLILQGPPGVGKTFFARRLAQALVGNRSSARVGVVQFHQTYSYEDFVQGYRPTGTGFQLKNGVFYEFCRRAAADADNDYVFIIDEINRGNLSKVFGELMMLIEADKRDPDWAVPLTYANSLDEKFHVPKNVYLLGLMNTADRSLAMVDYALRRRFAFIDLEPGFSSPQFREYMRNARASEELIHRVVRDLQDLNAEIEADRANLGPGFRVGHSYFCSVHGPDGATHDWYKDVIETEVLPLLREYWFDDPSKVKQWESRLLGA
ncbi:AAA family ATPase [Variovorax sp. OK605]|uniref:AAA family ATPase n=1 Tax=Variovorax sp. OK605 TaxID=1855317 RepID=UPI0015A730DB|nr:AAA family ATPase [Variovorax sp. OK605]